ncbi:MAG TPA: hypothetical protein VK436_06790 [Methanocella sp.]|nr:hypothetical protein [Methanocella sp.]
MINYDFNKVYGNSSEIYPSGRGNSRWVREFLATNQISTVPHLECGLDSRIPHIDPSDTVR